MFSLAGEFSDGANDMAIHAEPPPEGRLHYLLRIRSLSLDVEKKAHGKSRDFSVEDQLLRNWQKQHDISGIDYYYIPSSPLDRAMTDLLSILKTSFDLAKLSATIYKLRKVDVILTSNIVRISSRGLF